METAAVVLAILGALAGPAAAQPCVQEMVAVHAAHEWGHDLAALAVGVEPVTPLALAGDKWDEGQGAEWRTIARAGFVAQHVLVGAALDRCMAQANVVHSSVYAARSLLEGVDLPVVGLGTDRLGDYQAFGDPHLAASVNLLTAAALAAIAEESR